MPTIIASNTFGSGDAGEVTIETPKLTMESGRIQAVSEGAGRAGVLRVQVGELTLRSGGQISNSTRVSGQGNVLIVEAAGAVSISGRNRGGRSGLFSTTNGNGDAGRVVVSAPTISLTDSSISTVAARGSQGNAGDIDIQVGTLTLSDGAQIVSLTRGAGQGGQVTIEAMETIALTGQETSTRPTVIGSSSFGDRGAGNMVISSGLLTIDGSFILSSAFSNGNAGNVTVAVEALTLRPGGQILTNTVGTGRGGTLTVTATGAVSISGQSRDGRFRSELSSDTAGRGDAGNLILTASILHVEDGRIDTSTQGRRRAGDMMITADTIALSGDATIRGVTTGSGQGGNITVQAGQLTLARGGQINSMTTGAGQGGDILVQATDIELRNGGTISVRSTSLGAAGTIVIQARDTFQSVRSAVTTAAVQAGGGDIELEARLVSLVESNLTAEAMGGEGLGSDGGNVTLRASLVVLNESQVRANAFGGDGGNIQISAAEAFLASTDSILDASSELGLPGTVQITSPVIDLSGTVAPLPQTFADAAQLLQQRCANRMQGIGAASFVQGSRDQVPIEPGGVLPSPPLKPGVQRLQNDVRPGVGLTPESTVRLRLTTRGCRPRTACRPCR